MKKTLLSALLGLFSVVAFAQHDLQVTMVKPVTGQYIVNGQAWDVELTVTNNGSTAIAITDTLAVFPSIAGSYVINGFAEFAAIAPGASATINFVHPPLFGPDGNPELCVEVYAWQQTDADSSDNAGCNTLVWDSDPLVSIEEFSTIKIENNSFYHNGIYNVSVNNVYNHSNIKLSVINLSGQTVLSKELSKSNNALEESLVLTELNSGVYLFNISSNEGMNLSQKVMVN